MTRTEGAIAARLVEGGLAGPHQSHPADDNVAKARRLATGDPDATFGMPDVATATTEEALAAVAAVTGAREPGEAYIDPAATIAGVRAAAARLAAACRGGARILVATGHPGGLLRHHARLVEGIVAAGGHLVCPLDGSTVDRDNGSRRVLRYHRGVGTLTDGAPPPGGSLHTHSPAPMEHILGVADGDGLPELVVADHGFAGAAVAVGIPAIAVMDTNDPALAVAAARGRDLVLIPMDDNRHPDSYDVVAEMFEEALAQR